MKCSRCSFLFSFLLFQILPVGFSYIHVKPKRGAHTQQPYSHSSRTFGRQSRTAAEPDALPRKTHLTTFDPSCKHTYKNLYELDYNEDEIRNVSLFRKDYRLESYVGYPCKTSLYKKYEQDFLKKGLECPFHNKLEINFQNFIWKDLKNTLQTAPNLTIPVLNSSLLFQYICFSNQYEKCVFNQEKANMNGTCDGICECMDQVPVESYNYPAITNITGNQPFIRKENEIRCGVTAGGLCAPEWGPSCKDGGGGMGYNQSLEKNYKKKDFHFKCESDAGCHRTKMICECAQGYQCGGSDGIFERGPFNYVIWLIFWIVNIVLWICYFSN